MRAGRYEEGLPKKGAKVKLIFFFFLAFQELMELKQRTKVVMDEQGSSFSNEELAKVKKEAAFTRQLLKELVQSLSKGSFTIPSASEIISNLSVASASENEIK